MSIPRKENFSIESLELMIKCSQKPYISYEEGATLYSVGRNTFIKMAQERC